MTIIAGYRSKNGKKAWLASDSIGSAETHLEDYGNKIISRKNWICGLAGSYRAFDLIKESPELNIDLHGISGIRTFRDTLKQIRIEDGSIGQSSDTETIVHDVNLLVSYEGLLFVLETDYQIHKISKNGIITAGSGYAYASGALFAGLRNGIVGRDLVKLGVEASKKYHALCGGRTFIRSTEK